MPTSKKSVQHVRLVPHIRPERYVLTLKPDLEAFTFEGREVIYITLDQPTKTITLHSKDIDIATCECIKGKTSQFADITYNKKNETVTFSFKNAIAKGKAKLTLVFSGIISDSLRGFYRSRYTIDGQTRHLATTQFEATDARRAFPCFDEPSHKAVFDVSLIVPGTHTAISNTLPTSVKEHEGGYKVIEFASTPRMSTYLLAFIIGEFEFIEHYTRDGVQVRVFTTPGKKHQAQFALDVAVRSLEFYNDYFGIPYPLPVLDLIALPDFESAAMENWGAVTFRESAILVDEEKTSLSNKQWVAIVVAHELAHQWFGNLVTMHWWTDLWLNEGFASYMEYLCTDHMFPEWKVWDLFLADRYAVALRLDALKNSHPIEIPVHHPDEISEIFDTVSYCKGAAVIRMLAEYLGHDTFRDGLRHYLKKHSYENTQTTDLWDAFEKISKKPVRKIMETWTQKTGYPLVSIQKKGKGYVAKQERFFSSRVSAAKNKEKTLWHIPFTYQSNTEVQKELLTKKSSPLLGTSIGKGNIGEGSLVRVEYDAHILSEIETRIKKNELPLHDRLGVIRDLFALAEGGYVPTTIALEFSLVFRNETEYVVWSELASGIDRVYALIAKEPWANKYKTFARNVFLPLKEKMGWEKKKGEDHSDAFLRSLALTHAALYSDTATVKQAQKLFANSKKNPLPADIRNTVYGIVAMYGGEKEWKEFRKRYASEELHEEMERFGNALAQFKKPDLLKKTLEFALSKNVRGQDAPFMIARVWQNSRGRDLTWAFVKKNWTELTKRYGEGGHFLSRLLSPLGGHKSAKDAKEIQEFFKKHKAPGAERTIEQALERIYSNAAWLTEDRAIIKKWIIKNYT